MNIEWQTELNAVPLDWLLEPDPVNPGVRYFALRDLLDRPEHDPEVIAARKAIMETGPVPIILDAQQPEGYWSKPERIYADKYRGTVWQVLFLAQLGADPADPRVRKGAEYTLDYGQASNGVLAYNGRPSGAIHCMWGNLARALLDFGYWGDPRLERAIDQLARSVTGDGFSDYYRSTLRGPEFMCASNGGLSCGWGAVRVLWALNAVPADARTPAVQAGIDATVDFLLRYDIAKADYPYQERINSSWFKFGYPLAYVTDMLLNLEVLTEAGVVDHPKLEPAVRLVLSLQDDQGRWKHAYGYKSKMWVDIEQKGKPGKWVTLRVMRVLKRLGLALEAV